MAPPLGPLQPSTIYESDMSPQCIGRLCAVRNRESKSRLNRKSMDTKQRGERVLSFVVSRW